jgi:NAD(P)-dependent dehydrogenase (short-subunit alcohol dehydrogenase family)
MNRLDGRTAVVTGAAAGLGAAITARFLAEGARVVAADVREDIAARVEETHGRGAAVTAVVCDVTSPAGARLALDTARGLGDRVDVLVNNAGRFGGSTLLDTTDEEWQFHLTLNLTSQFVMCRTFVAAMVEQEEVDGVRGRIVNMASQLGITAPPAALGYAVAKAGVIQLTRQLAVDYARAGIVVNAIAPGRIITGDHPGERDDLGTVDAATEFSLSRTPFPRLGRPDDVAGAALYLASDDSSFVSGSVLSVDGGWTAY